MFSIWVRCSRLSAHAHGPPGSGAQAGRAPTAALSLSGWSSAVVPWARKRCPLPERLPTYRHQLRFHSRNVCQRPIQDHAAVWSPLPHPEKDKDSSPGGRRAFAHLIPLKALRAFLELSVDRAAKNSPRQALPPALPHSPAQIQRLRDRTSIRLSATFARLHSTPSTSL